ncbi:MAG: SMP-30/gluconolactonase/LRE family protein [Betaproteobacteria bacterium]|nr:SMP-30/gluconolactonase/LRE family protein [Betaproteobacteria bacterium]MDH4323960.1 SMP-30/gluconolactonase/LRE family protein [Betaproteobacteria bacterium]MDH5578283.1 SMP-30/gluconolactonase/LRE family protein [Betaproteobacteria bacterium]
MAFQVEVAVRGADRLGECPLWDERQGMLWWVDSRWPAVKRLDPATGAVMMLVLPEIVGSIALREAGGMLAATKRGLHFLDPASGALAPVVDPETALPGNRFNDGRCDRAGRFWAGTMSDVNRTPVGSLYRFDADLRATKLRNAIVVPNSLAFSPDGRTMYFADTWRNTIWCYDYDPDSGAATRERVFVDAGKGRPDGSCVDAEGCLWNADYGASRLVRYTPAGKVDRTVDLPVTNPTCCCFGGEDLGTLYVTTATQRLTPEALAQQPLAGSLLALRPGVKGLPESRFAG